MSVEIDKYQNCLLEIKKRTEVIASLISEEKTTGYLIVDVELVCLQFRKIIELIALSSLVANKEIYAQQREKFKEDWNARLIFQDLERMNPKFYPNPSEQIEKTTKSGERYYHFEPLTSGFLSKENALKIYERCGGILHAENPFKNKRNIAEIKAQFHDWIIQLITLMNHHLIVLNNGNMVVGIMHSKDDGNPYAFLFAKTPEEFQQNFFGDINNP